MRNRTYGGVRGRKTKVGRKLLRFPPTRFIGRTKCVLNDEYKEKVYFNSFLPHIFMIS